MNPTMECPRCKEIEFEHIDTLTAKGKSDILEYKCSVCGEYATFDEAAEELELQHWWAAIDQDEEYQEKQE